MDYMPGPRPEHVSYAKLGLDRNINTLLHKRVRAEINVVPSGSVALIDEDDAGMRVGRHVTIPRESETPPR